MVIFFTFFFFSSFSPIASLISYPLYLHAQVDMPVFFYIDPEFAEDPLMARVSWFISLLHPYIHMRSRIYIYIFLSFILSVYVSPFLSFLSLFIHLSISHYFRHSLTFYIAVF